MDSTCNPSLFFVPLHFQNVYRSVKIRQVLDALEQFAPLPLQESWDNAGLQLGLTEADVSGALLSSVIIRCCSVA